MTLLIAVTAILTGNTAPGAIPVKDLAPEIIKVAKIHKVDPKLVAKIVVLESAGRPNAFNSATDDHGLMQINKATALAYGITPKCLRDWRCNLDAGTKVLADMMAMKGARQCFYNLGPKGRLKKYEGACLRYERKLATID